ncbi:hypothetical protein [Dyella sp.]|uniref:hypothetical protein n=1 Tax=Dyella sp. TaxID=1869338 RepID=UPI002ECFFB4D
MKSWLICVATLLLLPLLALAAYDVCVFQPARLDMRIAIAHAPAADRVPSPGFAAQLQMQTPDLVPYSTRLLMRQVDFSTSRYWGLHYFLWSQLNALHLSDDERLAIIASQGFPAPYGPDLVHASQCAFGEQPDQLDSSDMTALVWLIRDGARQKTCPHA